MTSQAVKSLEILADELVERIATAVAEKLRGGAAGFIDQSSSPLGARRHCAAVRRRIGRGETGAAVVGRRHLLSADALAQELGERPRPRRPSAPVNHVRNIHAELEQELLSVAQRARQRRTI